MNAVTRRARSRLWVYFGARSGRLRTLGLASPQFGLAGRQVGTRLGAALVAGLLALSLAVTRRAGAWGRGVLRAVVATGAILVLAVFGVTTGGGLASIAALGALPDALKGRILGAGRRRWCGRALVLARGEIRVAGGAVGAIVDALVMCVVAIVGTVAGNERRRHGGAEEGGCKISAFHLEVGVGGVGLESWTRLLYYAC